MKKILVPTDYSQCAEGALQYAVKLAKHQGAGILIHHSTNILNYASKMPLDNLSEDKIYDEVATHLDQYIQQHDFSRENISVESSAGLGMAADNIISLASETKADLIVMGTTGASGITEAFIGSNATAVIERSPCPVLIVPVSAHYTPIKKIAYATDYREKDFRSIQYVCELAASYDAEVFVVHISEITQTDALERDLFNMFKEDVASKSSYKNISFHFYTGVNIAESLNTFMDENSIDLLSLTTRKRNLLSRFFDRSLTKKLACHTHIPLLSISLS